MNKEEYLKLKELYQEDTVFLSFHKYDHPSLKKISDDSEKDVLLPTIKEELINNPSWFDLIAISFITKIPSIYYTGKEGRFEELRISYISFLTKQIRKLKLDELK